MDHLALKGVHRLEREGFPAGLDLVGSLGSQGSEDFAALGPVTGHIKHQAGALTRFAQNRQPGQFLQGVKDLTVVAHQDIHAFAGHGHDSSVAFDVHVNSAIITKVSDVQHSFDVVGGNVAFLN